MTLGEAEDRLDALLDALLRDEAVSVSEIRDAWSLVGELRGRQVGGVQSDGLGQLRIESDRRSFAAYIWERRKCLGLSLQAFADAVGLGKSHLSNVEHARAHQVEIPTLLRLAWGLQEPPLALLRRLFPGVRWSSPAGGFEPPPIPPPQLPPPTREVRR